MITVAIPTLNGAAVLERTLASVTGQRLPDQGTLEVLVCDSGSRDGSVSVARRFGAEVIEIPSGSFSHGGTRNLLMDRAAGDHVAFLSQDAIPADERWLARLLEGFSLADDVALVFGPYRPQPDASVMVTRELNEWFRRFSPDGEARIDRLAESERSLPSRGLLGARAYFTDANGCIARSAWRTVPFRPVPYAEDHVLAIDMLRAGYAKVFMPSAAVIHSHEYSAWSWLRRAFDEARAVNDVYGFAPRLQLGGMAKNVWGLVGADWRWAAAAGHKHSLALLWHSTIHHAMRTAGSALGGQADRLPPSMVGRLSLEGRVR